MSTKEIAISNDGQIAHAEAFMPVMRIQQAVQRYDAVLKFTKDLMKDGKDFGKIPGVDKPTLLKPGAEKLCSFFGLSPKFSIVGKAEEWSGDEPFFYYWYKCEVWRGAILIAEGEGSCNSRESKYRYRWVGDDQLPAGMDGSKLPSRGGMVSEFTFAVDKAETGGKYGKPDTYWQAFRDGIASGSAQKVKKSSSKGKEYDAWEIENTVYRVPNPDVADQVNTIQKMAQKRALIAATLIACNASEYYTQDVEDMAMVGNYSTGETREEIVGRRVREATTESSQSSLPAATAGSGNPPHPSGGGAAPASSAPSEDTQAEEVPLIVQQAWAKMVNIKGAIETFGLIKDMLIKAMGTEVGEQEYYRILGLHGAEHANSFKRLEPARMCAQEMLMAAEAAKESANV